MTIDDIKTRLEGLIEAGWISCPGGDFFLKIPATQWDQLEESLNRSKMDRKYMPRVLKWRGEYVERGAVQWTVCVGDQ